MQITIELPPDLEQDLIRQASHTDVSLQTFILQALRQITQTQKNYNSQWSEIVLSYTGDPDFPTFESYRDELLPLRDLELF